MAAKSRNVKELPVLPSGYQYVKEIACGGQAAVWLVVNGNMGKPGRYEAVKILDSSCCQSVSFKRFCQEISTLANLSHPNIVTIYYAIPEEGYFIMEYLSGGTLDTLMKKEETSLLENLKIFHQLLEGLHFAHSKGLIHRDLKPHNILFSTSGVPKITDFGLTKVQEVDAGSNDMTMSQAIIGTPYYMSPEQWENPKGVDARTDIWAMGIILYQMLTHQFPYQPNTNLMYAALTKPIIPPHVACPSLSDLAKSVSPVCMHALEKDPSKRYQTAKEIARDLANILEQRIPIPASQEDSREELFKGELTLKNDEEVHSPLPNTEDNAISRATEEPLSFMDEDSDKQVADKQVSQTPDKQVTQKPNGQSAQKTDKQVAQKTDKQVAQKTDKQVAQKTDKQIAQKNAANQKRDTSVKPPSRKQTNQMQKPSSNRGIQAPIATPQTPIAKASPKLNIVGVMSKISSTTIATILIGIIAVITLFVFFKKPNSEKVQEILLTGTLSQQQEALAILKKYSDDEAISILITALNSEYSQIRSSASNKLSRLASQATPHLIYLLKNDFIKYRLESQIATLDLIAQLQAKGAESSVRNILSNAKNSEIQQAAIACLVAIEPENQKKFSSYNDKWYSNRDMETRGYIFLNEQWCDPESFFKPSLSICENASNQITELQNRRDHHKNAMVNCHPESIDFTPWRSCITLYQQAWEQAKPLTKYEGKPQLTPYLDKFQTEIARGVTSLAVELTKHGEDIQKTKPVCTLKIYEQIQDIYNQAVLWPWTSNKQIVITFQQEKQNIERRISLLQNDLRMGVVLEIPQKFQDKVQQQLKDAISHVFMREGKIACFTNTPRELSKKFLFAVKISSTDLKEDNVTEKLRPFFEENGINLSDQIAVQIEDTKYRIEDEINKRQYLIVSKNDGVEIHQQDDISKWLVVEYNEEQASRQTTILCHISYYYQWEQGEAENPSQEKVSLKPTKASKPDSFWQVFRQWQPDWKVLEVTAVANNEDTRPIQKVKGSTLSSQTANDVIHLKDGSKIEGIIAQETEAYVEVVYFHRPTATTKMLARDKISREKIARIEPLSKEVRAERLQQIANMKSSGEEEAKGMREIQIKPIAWEFSKGSSGLEHTSERFVLISNAPEDFVRQVSYRVQEIFKAYEGFFRVVRNQDVKIKIYIFNSMKEYYQATGGKILNPAFYMPAKNYIVAGCDLEKYRQEVAEIREHHKKIATDIENYRKKIEEVKDKIRKYKREEHAKWDRSLREGGISRDQYDDILRQIRKWEEGNIDMIRKYQAQLREFEDKMRSCDYKNKKLLEKYAGIMLKILYHEAFHAFLDNFLFEQQQATQYVPLWLNEGMAQFFENSYTEGGKLYIGKMDTQRVKLLKQYIRDKKVVPMSQLLVADSSQFIVQDATNLENSNIHYLQSWAVVYYLSSQYNLQSGNFFASYVYNLQKRGNAVTEFQKLVEQPLDQFDQLWQQALLNWK